MNTITVQTIVNAPISKVWECWTKPEHLAGWAFASNDWEAVPQQNDLRNGGKFKTRMQAKDKSAGFDFEGTYTAVKENVFIEFDMSDQRHVKVEFTSTPGGTQVTETFDAENENSKDSQRQGWQAFLDNFKKYVESNNKS